ncbi:PadR family transcriptional regulator [Streptomyces montanisoli]|uniref:PadR family transcriptional regulator n=1 Tax=Streptomyces montanisoli TaxID=2798581 RepID=A0A940RUA1_9ACTN|nr:PadR family transcriptional regulator [Streptomyces montanisoli]MBP0457011.1 PadR family transcriptional regulator [Streptomyces montanisoli]
MSTRHILLGLLAMGPRHGYDLKHRHDERFPQARPLAFGQVYTTLQRLVRDGLAEVEETGSDGGPERTMYRSTDAGARELADWAGSVTPSAPFVANEIFAKVVVAILSGGDPAAYLAAQRASHMQRMRELTAVKSAKDADLTTVLSADYALTHLNADLRWMTTTADRLATLTAEVEST